MIDIAEWPADALHAMKNGERLDRLLFLHLHLSGWSFAAGVGQPLSALLWCQGNELEIWRSGLAVIETAVFPEIFHVKGDRRFSFRWCSPIVRRSRCYANRVRHWVLAYGSSHGRLIRWAWNVESVVDYTKGFIFVRLPNVSFASFFFLDAVWRNVLRLDAVVWKFELCSSSKLFLPAWNVAFALFFSTEFPRFGWWISLHALPPLSPLWKISMWRYSSEGTSTGKLIIACRDKCCIDHADNGVYLNKSTRRSVMWSIRNVNVRCLRVHDVLLNHKFVSWRHWNNRLAEKERVSGVKSPF